MQVSFNQALKYAYQFMHRAAEELAIQASLNTSVDNTITNGQVVLMMNQIEKKYEEGLEVCIYYKYGNNILR